MIGYSLQEKFLTDADVSLHIRATRLVERVPYKLRVRGEKVVVRCHELALAVGAVLGLDVCDGYYGMLEHSWLWTSEFERYMPLPNILDVYAPGCHPQVVLIHTSTCIPLNYRRGAPRTDIDADVLKELLNLMLPEKALTAASW